MLKKSYFTMNKYFTDLEVVDSLEKNVLLSYLHDDFIYYFNVCGFHLDEIRAKWVMDDQRRYTIPSDSEWIFEIDVWFNTGDYLVCLNGYQGSCVVGKVSVHHMMCEDGISFYELLMEHFACEIRDYKLNEVL